jgi:hypothetical protein
MTVGDMVRGRYYHLRAPRTLILGCFRGTADAEWQPGQVVPVVCLEDVTLENVLLSNVVLDEFHLPQALVQAVAEAEFQD